MGDRKQPTPPPVGLVRPTPPPAPPPKQGGPTDERFMRRHYGASGYTPAVPSAPASEALARLEQLLRECPKCHNEGHYYVSTKPETRGQIVSEDAWHRDGVACNCRLEAADLVAVLRQGQLDVYGQLIRYLDAEFGLALRPRHAEHIKVLLSSQAEVLATQHQVWKCGANASLDPPQDCDWPVCGCDPSATKVIETLVESGWTKPATPPLPSPEALEIARRVARVVLLEVDTDEIALAPHASYDQNELALAVLRALAESGAVLRQQREKP